MPTGYTAALCDGEQSFEEFVLTCARNFGALITMRDAPMDADVPESFEADSYHAKALAKANDRLAELNTMTLLDCAATARREYDEWVAAEAKRDQETVDTAKRLNDMRAKVLAWTPPTDEHTGLRDFMVQQLDITLEYEGRPYHGTPPPVEAIEWHDKQIAKALRDIAYNAEQFREERDRAKQRTAWVRSLRKSLPSEGVPA